ncbi:MAG: hypothetical protein ACKOA8_05135 [Deltaproteobacteria bacterium]
MLLSHQQQRRSSKQETSKGWKLNTGKLSNGGGYSRIGEPLTVEEEYETVWKQARLDTNELARLRSEGWTVNQLVAHFGYSRTAIKNNLRQSGKEVCSHN